MQINPRYRRQLAGLGDVATIIDSLAADASAVIQATTRPNQPAYTGNIVPTAAPSSAMSSGAMLALVAFGGLALYLMMRR